MLTSKRPAVSGGGNLANLATGENYPQVIVFAHAFVGILTRALVRVREWSMETLVTFF